MKKVLNGSKKFIAYEKFFGNARSKFSTILNKAFIHSENSKVATLLSKIQIDIKRA